MVMVLAMFLVVVGRYVLIAGLFHVFFYKIGLTKWRHRRLGKKKVSNRQYFKEIRWSAITAFIFAVFGAATVVFWQKGYTTVYTEANEYGYWYLPVSLLISMFIHETYYYWLHRWMHKPKVFKIMHKVHHDSNTTSPWTAFSFHPIEGIFQAVILPVTLLVLPMHPYVLLLQLTIMTFSSVVNHLEIEVYPKGFSNHFIGKWLIGATHHSLHHKEFKHNYGLYFTIWDKWKRTESPTYQKLFAEKTHRQAKT